MNYVSYFYRNTENSTGVVLIIAARLPQIETRSRKRGAKSYPIASCTRLLHLTASTGFLPGLWAGSIAARRVVAVYVSGQKSSAIIWSKDQGQVAGKVCFGMAVSPYAARMASP